jgi:hypothetical protein
MSSPVVLDAESVARELAVYQDTHERGLSHHGGLSFLSEAELLELAEAILLEVGEAVRRVDTVASVHVNPNGTFEFSYITLGKRKGGKIAQAVSRTVRAVTGR